MGKHIRALTDLLTAAETYGDSVAHEALTAAIALMRGQSEPVVLTENEKIAMEVFGELKDMRGDFTESDPDELAEFASMCLNTVIHLGLLVERAITAPPAAKQERDDA